MRHGEAENIGAEYPSDGVRPLTVNGRKRLELSTKGMSASGVAEFSDALPTGDIDGIVQVVHAAAGYENVMLVGHEPTLTGLISVLLSGTLDTSIDMQPGGLCMLTLDAIVVGQCATLRWFLVPQQLVALGK
jgi:phosphohistidine phosphatase SixA